MAKAQELRARLADLLHNQRLAVLATQSGEQPHLSLMAFVAYDDLRRLIFVTERNTRKFANILTNQRTAVLVDDRSAEAGVRGSEVAVTALGRAEELEGQARIDAADLLVGKHPDFAEFARAADCAVVQVTVEAYYLVRQFQEVEVWQP